MTVPTFISNGSLSKFAFDFGTPVKLMSGKVALYLGPGERGLHVVAECSEAAPFWRENQSIIDAGGREFPNLHRATWHVRTCRVSSIASSLEEFEARVKADHEARLQLEREEGERNYKLDQARRRIAAVFENCTEGVTTYIHDDRIAVFGEVEVVELLADRVEAVLADYVAVREGVAV